MATTPVFNVSRILANTNGSALTSGVATGVSVKLNSGVTVNNISFATGTTAAGTPTHWAYAIYDYSATPVLLGQTADQTTTAMAANTVYTKALQTPVVTQKAGTYYLAIFVTATTVPTLLSGPAQTAGLLNTTGLLAGDKPLAVTFGSGLTTTFPGTIASGGTNSLVIPVAWIS